MDEPRPRRRSRRCAAAALAAVVLAACGGGDGDPPRAEPAPSDTAGAIRDLGEVGEAVVRVRARGSFAEPGDEPAGDAELRTERVGSGFLVDPAGVVVTDHHLVAGAATVEVTIGTTGRTVPAEVLGRSECDDLAVLRIEGDEYPYLRWAGADPEAGTEVRAAGFGTGDDRPVLSAGEVVAPRAGGDLPRASFPAAVAYDVPVDEARAGGPLVMVLDAGVVAVDLAAEDPTGEDAHARAVPADRAAEVVEVLREGDLRSLGVNGEAVRAPADGVIGVWVAAVVTGSPADEAGVRPGDVIERIEGLPMANDGTLRDYCDVLRSHDPTDVLKVQVLRVADGVRLAGELNGDPIEPYESLVADVEEDTGDALAEGESYDYVTVTDDTGLLVVDVPREWADLATETIALEGGAELPQIVAAPDLDAYLETFDGPGMSFAVDLDGAISIDDFLASSDFSADCLTEGPEPYDDGLYTGRVEYWTDCGERDSVLVVIAARPPGSEFTLRVVAQVLSDSDVEALDTIVRTFRVDLGGDDGPVDDGPVDDGPVDEDGVASRARRPTAPAAPVPSRA